MYAVIICECCGTGYKVKPEQIPEEGRKVRCASCGHLWFQSPLFESDPEENIVSEEDDDEDDQDIDDDKEQIADFAEEEDDDEEDDDDEEEVEEESQEDGDETVEDDDALTDVDTGILEGQEESTKGVEATSAVKDKPVAAKVDKVAKAKMLETHKDATDKTVKKTSDNVQKTKTEKTVEQEKPKIFSSLALIFASCVNVLLLVFVLLGVFKSDIPAVLLPVYNVLGVSDSSLLEFDNVSVLRDDSGNLVIKANIINNASKPRVIPKIRFRMIDVAGKVVFSDTFLPAEGEKVFIERESKYSFTKKVKIPSRRASKFVMDMGNILELFLA